MFVKLNGALGFWVHNRKLTNVPKNEAFQNKDRLPTSVSRGHSLVFGELSSCFPLKATLRKYKDWFRHGGDGPGAKNREKTKLPIP